MFYNFKAITEKQGMRKNTTLITLFITFILPLSLFAQLKKDTVQPDFTSVLSKPADYFLLDFSDPSKFQMSHSFSMSFGMGGGNQVLQNTYMNTMSFQLSESMSLTTNLGILSTPYHTFGEKNSLSDPQFFGGAELSYQISEKSSLHFRFESSPYGYYNYRNPYYSPFYRPSNWNNDNN